MPFLENLIARKPLMDSVTVTSSLLKPIFIYFFYFLFTQYFKRVTHLAKIAILLSGPLLTY